MLQTPRLEDNILLVGLTVVRPVFDIFITVFHYKHCSKNKILHFFLKKIKTVVKLN